MKRNKVRKEKAGTTEVLCVVITQLLGLWTIRKNTDIAVVCLEVDHLNTQ